MTQIAVHPYHAETGLSLSSNVASEWAPPRFSRAPDEQGEKAEAASELS